MDNYKPITTLETLGVNLGFLPNKLLSSLFQVRTFIWPRSPLPLALLEPAPEYHQDLTQIEVFPAPWPISHWASIHPERSVGWLVKKKWQSTGSIHVYVGFILLIHAPVAELQNDEQPQPQPWHTIIDINNCHDDEGKHNQEIQIN